VPVTNISKQEGQMLIELPQKLWPHANGAAATVPSVSVPEPENERVILSLPLKYRGMFYPLGFAVEVTTNEEAVLEIVRECWGGLGQLHANPALQVRIEVRDAGPAECPPAPVLRLQRNLFTVAADAYNHAVCDLTHGFSLVWLNHAALRHRRYLKYHFIETAAYILISNSYTTPVHAACVSRYGHGMLLAADSGVGKSSLSYACARAGWTYTSDDGSFLVRHGDEPRVVGNCRLIRFRPSARELFPELQGRKLTPRVQGKPSIEVPTSELGLITADQAVIHSIIFLHRQPGARAQLVPLPRGVAIQRFRQWLEPIEEVREQQIATLKQLSSVDAYDFQYEDLESAIACLDRLARGVEMPVA
jgi:hypothetical protein